MFTETINTYLLIVKNKLFNNGGRLRVNMCNIYAAQKQYPQAIKMYRMALDQTGETHKSVRYTYVVQHSQVCIVQHSQVHVSSMSWVRVPPE